MFICLATVTLCLLRIITLSKKENPKIRFNNLLVPEWGPVFEPGSVRSGFEHGSVFWTNETHSHKIHGNCRGTEYNYFNVQSFTGVSVHRDPLPHKLYILWIKLLFISGSHKGLNFSIFNLKTMSGHNTGSGSGWNFGSIPKKMRTGVLISFYKLQLFSGFSDLPNTSTSEFKNISYYGTRCGSVPEPFSQPSRPPLVLNLISKISFKLLLLSGSFDRPNTSITNLKRLSGYGTGSGYGPGSFNRQNSLFLYI